MLSRPFTFAIYLFLSISLFPVRAPQVPLPPPGRIEVEVDVLGQRQIFKRPPPNQQPLADLNFSVLFRLLSVENVINLFAAVLAERRVLLVSYAGPEDLAEISTSLTKTI